MDRGGDDSGIDEAHVSVSGVRGLLPDPLAGGLADGLIGTIAGANFVIYARIEQG